MYSCRPHSSSSRSICAFLSRFKIVALEAISSVHVIVVLLIGDVDMILLPTSTFALASPLWKKRDRIETSTQSAEWSEFVQFAFDYVFDRQLWTCVLSISEVNFIVAI